jgi:hypothetical protein
LTFSFENYISNYERTHSEYNLLNKLVPEEELRQAEQFDALRDDPFLYEEFNEPISGDYDSWVLCKYRNQHLVDAKYHRDMEKYLYSGVKDKPAPSRVENQYDPNFSAYTPNTYSSRCDPFERDIIVEIYQYQDRVPNVPDKDNASQQYRHWCFKVLDFSQEAEMTKEEKLKFSGGPIWTDKKIGVCERDMNLPALFAIDSWCRWVGIQRPRKLLRFLRYNTEFVFGPRVACVIRVLIYKHVKKYYTYEKEKKAKELEYKRITEENEKALSLFNGLSEEQQTLLSVQKEMFQKQLVEMQRLKSSFEHVFLSKENQEVPMITDTNDSNPPQHLPQPMETIQETAEIEKYTEKHIIGSTIFDNLSASKVTENCNKIELSLNDIQQAIIDAVGIELEQEYDMDDEELWISIHNQLVRAFKSNYSGKSVFILKTGEWKKYIESYFTRNGEGTRFHQEKTELEVDYANISDDEFSEAIEKRNAEMLPKHKKHVSKTTKAIEKPIKDNQRAKIVNKFASPFLENYAGGEITFKPAVTLDKTVKPIYARSDPTRGPKYITMGPGQDPKRITDTPVKGSHLDGKIVREINVAGKPRILVQTDYGYDEQIHDSDIPEFNMEANGIKPVEVEQKARKPQDKSEGTKKRTKSTKTTKSTKKTPKKVTVQDGYDSSSSSSSSSDSSSSSEDEIIETPKKRTKTSKSTKSTPKKNSTPTKTGKTPRKKQ